MGFVRAHVCWWVVSSLALLVGVALADEPLPAPTYVEAEIYEVFHGDSLHRLGIHVREIHVPSRGFAFYVRQGELRVFRPEAHRYLLPGTKLVVKAPDGSPMEFPWMQMPGCETGHVGSTRIRVADADRLVSLLEENTRLRTVADHYLRPDAARDLTTARAIPPVPPDADVLHHLARFPGSETVVEDGVQRQPKYGDADLELAENTLTGRLSRPWTVAVLSQAYAVETEEAVRAALIYLLAASRSSEALALVGAALSDEALDVRVRATYGILTYWDQEGTPDGGTEQAMERAQAWWNTHTR